MEKDSSEAKSGGSSSASSRARSTTGQGGDGKERSNRGDEDGEQGATDPGDTHAEDEDASVTTGGGEATDNTEDPSEPEGHCERAGSERRCVPKAPMGWGGPVGLRQGESTREVSDCPSHDPLVTELYDEVWAAPATCSGCTPKLRLPKLQLAKVNLFSQSPCEAPNLKESFSLDESRCLSVYKTDDWSAYWSYEPPQAMGEVQCKGILGSRSRSAWKKNTVFRGCRVLRNATCDSPEQVCALRSSGMMCVFREGEHQCPELYSESRKVLYQNVEDTRECEGCKGVLEKGVLKIGGQMSFYKEPSCAGSPRHSLDFSALEGVCSPNEAQADKEWRYVKAQSGEVEYTGGCTTTPWKPVGGVQPRDPVTLCCSSSK